MAKYTEDDEDLDNDVDQSNDDDDLASEADAAELSQIKPVAATEAPPKQQKEKIDKELADNSDEADLDQEMADSEPEESPVPANANMLSALEAIKASKNDNPQLSKFQDYMDQYRALQEQQKKSDLVNGLIAAGGKIGQSMAGKYSGNFVPDQTGNQMLAKMAERPTQQFELGQAVQGRGMTLQAEMAAADPNSPQSKLVRSYVEKRLGLKLDDDVSAADAQMLLKTVGRPIQTKFQKVNGTWTDPATGESKRMSAVFDPGTGTYKDADTGKSLPGFLAEGLNPFQSIINPNTGEREVFNKSRGGAPTPTATGKPPVGQAQTPQDVNASLDPVTRKELNDKIVPNFNKLTEKTQQRLMHQAPIMAKLEEAQLNPAAYAQLQAELARFDVGDQRLAQQEFNMFATRHGYKGWGDWVQKNSTGTVSEDFANDFAHTINNTVRGMQDDLSNQAEKQAQLLINRLPPGQRVDPKIVAPLIYAGYKPVSSGKSGKQIIKKGYNPTSNKTQLIYSDGTKEIVDGRQ